MRKQKQFHYIYRINRFDGKYYIGMHSTNNLDDGYFGSGKYLRNSINYHGIDKHTKEIIEFLPDRQSLKDRERQLVNEECISDPLCMNIKKGGEGGWDHINESGKNLYGVNGCVGYGGDNLKSGKDLIDIMIKNGTYSSWKNNISTTLKKYQSEFGNSFKNKTHTEEAKRKIGEVNSVKQKGEKNSQYGTCWITKDGINKKIKKDDLDIWLEQGYVKGRRFD